MSSEKSKVKKRASWDEYFMNLAQLVATRATCNRGVDLKYMPGFKGVGAIIVRDQVVISTGYNGSPRGLDHCDETGHEMVGGHCVRTVHAEANALVQAARHGVAVKSGTIYTTASPCYDCFKMLVNAGIARIVCGAFYGSRYGASEKVIALAAQAGVQLEFFSRPEHAEKQVEETPDLFSPAPDEPVARPNSPEIRLNVKLLHPMAVKPRYAYAGDVGLDLSAVEGARLGPGERAKIMTGLAVEIPDGYAGLIWDRSSLSAQKGLKVMGGVIDSSYRGELMVPLANISDVPVEIVQGDRVAQMLIQPVSRVEVEVSKELTETERDKNAFGSTDSQGMVPGQGLESAMPGESAPEDGSVEELNELERGENEAHGRW